ncbi:MAG: DUF58 domain-containing protein [Bacteroidales bacterium]|jgi:uncharacterized protein (DUF58 family)|nr:DUF58 domain-containing protein [Bacteroidales bacterium]NCU35251.1 DUF58 domain-containing protein [Candidatus Falkowbacteria bacterium]MDD2631024.1 DUF58 domain-containing protein [Bacteroidales bacterium]MDD3526072.1 DUF58 domain-containing protein [Bacteroidales bacterium]MDD4175962.1 DUF58 domain-containing protein [Bacteroidales bacterium]
MDASEIFKKVRKIEIKTRGLSNQIFSGQYHSAFKGRGMAFSEVREYQYGDDIRSIDWNVTARFNHPFIKIFEEERELTVMLLIDVSGSNEFGTRSMLKEEMITEIAAVLAFSAIQNNDKVGVIFFSNQIEKFIPPKKGSTHILRIIRELVDFKTQNQQTKVSESLRFLTNGIKKRCTAFVLSDFMDKGFDEALQIANNKHDVIAIRVFDERETELPNIGLAKFKDAETGKTRWTDTSSSTVRRQYRQEHLDNEKYLRRTFLKSGVDVVNIRTDQDYVKQLIGLFKRREARA